MSTENTGDMRDFLAESDKLLKQSEKSLKRMDKVRNNIGLKPGASKEFMEHIPGNADKRKEAADELRKFLKDAKFESLPESKEDKARSGKRSKLAKAMNRNLRI